MVALAAALLQQQQLPPASANDYDDADADEAAIERRASSPWLSQDMRSAHTAGHEAPARTWAPAGASTSPAQRPQTPQAQPRGRAAVAEAAAEDDVAEGGAQQAAPAARWHSSGWQQQAADSGATAGALRLAAFDAAGDHRSRPVQLNLPAAGWSVEYCSSCMLAASQLCAI
jgi:hypothetical protein